MNDVPLVQKNDINSINTSLIAIKKQLKQLTEAVGLIDVPDLPDLSPYVKKTDVVDVVEAGNMNPVTSNAVVPVDEVAVGNMHSVSSNAVAETLKGDNETISGVIFSKIGNLVAVKAYGITCQTLRNITIPEKYRPMNISTCLIYIRYGNYAHLGFLGVRPQGDFYVTYLPSYPADNSNAPDSAYAYFDIVYSLS